MYKLLTTAKGFDDLSIGFDRDRKRTQREITNNKNQKENIISELILKDFSGFVEQQEKSTSGLGYKLTLTRNSDNVVLNNDNAINIGKIKFIAIEWYAAHATPSVSKQNILSNPILKTLPTELHFVERSVFIKEVNTQNHWAFELGTQEGINFPILNIIGFEQRHRQDSQILNNDTFYRPPVTSAQDIFGTEK